MNEVRDGIGLGMSENRLLLFAVGHFNVDAIICSANK